jgi:hypothetical protein
LCVHDGRCAADVPGHGVAPYLISHLGRPVAAHPLPVFVRALPLPRIPDSRLRVLGVCLPRLHPHGTAPLSPRISLGFWGIAFPCSNRQYRSLNSQNQGFRGLVMKNEQRSRQQPFPLLRESGSPDSGDWGPRKGDWGPRKRTGAPKGDWGPRKRTGPPKGDWGPRTRTGP